MTEEIFPGFVYNPPTEEELKDRKTTLGIKFANDIFLSEAWMIKMNIKYKPEDIEQTPLGPCARIKRDE